jgi:hypothetical protein
MTEAVRTSETPVYSYETKRRYIPEGSNLEQRVNIAIKYKTTRNKDQIKQKNYIFWRNKVYTLVIKRGKLFSELNKLC